MILEKLERLSHREKTGLSVALGLLFLAAADNFAARPIVRTLRSLDGQIEMARNNLAYNLGALRWEDETNRQYERVHGLLTAADSPAEAIADMKGQIDALARKNGLTIQKMDHREPKAADGYDEYVVQIGSFESDVRSAIRFMQDIWQAPGMPRIVKLSLVPGAGRDAVKGSMSITKVMLKKSPSASPPSDAAEAAPAAAAE
jgi:hypothetical protein